MKTKLILLLIIGIGFFLNSYAQLNYHLPNDNAYQSVWDLRFVFDGDTIIGDQRYTKVNKQELRYSDEDGIPVVWDSQYFAAVREDTLAQKYYSIHHLDSEERLIADFDVKAGDKITVYTNWHFEYGGDWEFITPIEVEIKAVDSVVIKDGTTRKRVEIDAGYSYHLSPIYWIEGIGSTKGLFAPVTGWIWDVGENPLLLCFHIDDELVYQVDKNLICKFGAETPGIDCYIPWPMEPDIPNYKSYFGNTYTHWYTYYENVNGKAYSSKFTIENYELWFRMVAVYQSFGYSPDDDPQLAFYLKGSHADGNLYIHIDGEEDILVSTMDLEEGDKFYFPDHINASDFDPLHKDDKGYYTVVDSVYNKDGRRHIRCETIYNGITKQPLVFIEGIGPSISFDPFYSHKYGASGKDRTKGLICYESDDDSWKADFDWSSKPSSDIQDKECFFTHSLSIDQLDLSPLKISNEKGRVRIETESNIHRGVCSLYSVKGELIHKQEIQDESTVLIPTHSLSPGVYLLQINEEDSNRNWNEKVVVY